jgi:hypothetical protein
MDSRGFIYVAHISNFIAIEFDLYSPGFLHTYLEPFQQLIICFASVSSHHHNDHDNWAIEIVISIVRSMMLHSEIHWPDMDNPCLWPMAVQ